MTYTYFININWSSLSCKLSLFNEQFQNQKLEVLRVGLKIKCPHSEKITDL